MPNVKSSIANLTLIALCTFHYVPNSTGPKAWETFITAINANFPTNPIPITSSGEELRYEFNKRIERLNDPVSNTKSGFEFRAAINDRLQRLCSQPNHSQPKQEN